MSRRDIARASSVWVEMPFMRGPEAADRLRAWLPAYRQQRAATAARRERVLAYGWARERLCQILGLSDARNWNGYVPGARNADHTLNTYASRDDLIELLRQVAIADTQAVGPATHHDPEVPA